MNNFFISHHSKDKTIADVIATTLKRITLNQINPWFSSDSSGAGGITPGSVWLDSIREKLSSSKAIVVLLTPNSVLKPWLYFESGIGESNEGCEIIPVVIGFNGLSEIPFPLAMYQCYLLSDYNSLKRFCEKLLVKFEIMFDEEMTKPFIETASKKLNEFSFEASNKNQLTNTENNILIEEIRNHFDRKFLGLADRFEKFFTPSEKELDSLSVYQYEIYSEFNDKKIVVEIYDHETALDIMNSIYFQLEGNIKPYEYMITWIMEDKTGVKLDMLEFLSIIPAKDIFNMKYEWKVKRLKNKHNPFLSYDKLDEWFGNNLIK